MLKATTPGRKRQNSARRTDALHRVSGGEDPTSAGREAAVPVAGAGREARGRGRPRKTAKRQSIDIIYDAVVDAAKSGANVVITDDPDAADKTMQTLPAGGSIDENKTTEVPDGSSPLNETEQLEMDPGVESDIVPPLKIMMGGKRPLGRPPGRCKKKRRKMTPRKIVLKGGGEEEDVNSVFEAEIPNPDNLTEAVSAVSAETITNTVKRAVIEDGYEEMTKLQQNTHYVQNLVRSLVP